MASMGPEFLLYAIVEIKPEAAIFGPRFGRVKGVIEPPSGGALQYFIEDSETGVTKEYRAKDFRVVRLTHVLKR